MLHSVVGTQASGEQSVAIAHGESVVAGDAVGCQTARHAFTPHADVLACIAHNSRIAGGAAAGMHTYNLALRGSLQSERIVVAQVFLGCERQFCDVFDGLNVVRPDVKLL